jgi:DNA-3-methyladenine glycosylase
MHNRYTLTTKDTLAAAQELLGKLVVHQVGAQLLSGYIVETEAYLPDDPASHCYRGPTPRTLAMFQQPGTIYTYRSYGVHTCFNIIASPQGVGGGVLIRALEPFQGVEIMKKNRGQSDLIQLCNGPGKLTQALGLTLQHNGLNVVDADVWLEPGRNIAENQILATPRIGISKNKDARYRFIIKDSLFVSRRA